MTSWGISMIRLENLWKSLGRHTPQHVVRTQHTIVHSIPRKWLLYGRLGYRLCAAQLPRQAWQKCHPGVTHVVSLPQNCLSVFWVSVFYPHSRPFLPLLVTQTQMLISMLQAICLFSFMCEPFVLLWHGSVQVTSFLSVTKARDGLDGLVLFRLLIYHILFAFMYFSVSQATFTCSTFVNNTRNFSFKEYIHLVCTCVHVYICAAYVLGTELNSAGLVSSVFI